MSTDQSVRSGDGAPPMTPEQRRLLIKLAQVSAEIDHLTDCIMRRRCHLNNTFYMAECGQCHAGNYNHGLAAIDRKVVELVRQRERLQGELAAEQPQAA